MQVLSCLGKSIVSWDHSKIGLAENPPKLWFQKVGPKTNNNHRRWSVANEMKEKRENACQ